MSTLIRPLQLEVKGLIDSDPSLPKYTAHTSLQKELVAAVKEGKEEAFAGIQAALQPELEAIEKKIAKLSTNHKESSSSFSTRSFGEGPTDSSTSSDLDDESSQHPKK